LVEAEQTNVVFVNAGDTAKSGLSYRASFVVPAYDEEKSIKAVLGSIDNLIDNKLSHEIVVINDGSNDNTLAKITEYARKNDHVKVISCPSNMGKGHALKEGFLHSSGEIVIFSDSDMEIGLNSISSYLDALKYGDIVIASKQHPESKVEVPLIRKVLSRSFNALVRLFTGMPLRDTQSGLKAMKKSAFIDIFPKLTVDRYAFDVELLAAAHLNGLKVVEMPINIKMDASFKPKNILRMFTDLLRISYRLKVLHSYDPPVKAGSISAQEPLLYEPPGEHPFVSIIVPCKKIDTYTQECINHCKQLSYPNLEIIVLPDSVTEHIEGVLTIPTGPVSPGQKRNIGVRNSSGELCAFIDDDAYPRKDWLTKAVKNLAEHEVGGVGGPGLTPPEDGFLQKAGGYVLSSIMVGGLASRYRKEGQFESEDIHSCNFIAPKKVIEEAGGWNEQYWPGEDTLMCMAIGNLGKKLVESSDVVVYHHRRTLLKEHLMQVSRFGEHRGFFAKKFPKNSRRPTYFVPSLLILSLFSIASLSVFFPDFAFVLLFGAVVYLASTFMAAASEAKSLKLTFSVWAGIIATHAVYGVSFLSGLMKRELKR
jgi:glycosyltransferase involved in cell wall biosynthesis